MARQHSESFNLEDCFNHLLYMSDYILRKYASANESDENEVKKPKKPTEKTEDDIIFESLLKKYEIEE